MKEIFYGLQNIINRSAFYEANPWECLRALHRLEGDIIHYIATLKQMEKENLKDKRPVVLHPPRVRAQNTEQKSVPPPPVAAPIHPYNFMQGKPAASPATNPPIHKTPPNIPLAEKATPIPAPKTDLNDELRAQIPPSLSDFLHTRPIQDLKHSINLNDRFQFITDLFKGDETAFDNAIRILNEASDQQEAHRYLKDLMRTYQWHTLPGEQVNAFIQLVNRRFS